MAPRSKKRKSPRYKPSFNIKEILLYGIPVWLGAPILGWVLEGYLGLRSALIGLVIIGFYIAIEIIVAEQFKVIRDNKRAVTVLVGGLVARVAGLLIATYLLFRFTTVNLFVLLLTIVAGFTAMLFISTKNWINNQ